MSSLKDPGDGRKSKRGGARPGAGRKPKPAAVSNYDDPLDFLRAVWKGEIEATERQVRAATAALPYLRAKVGESGKKEQRQRAAETVVGAGRFSPSSPPRVVVDNDSK